MPLFAGIAREMITPEIGTLLAGYNDHTKSISINDELSVTALALKSGDTTVLLYSATVCLIHNKLADEIRAKTGEIGNIPADNVILSATHTHSGPNVAGFGGNKNKPFGNMNVEYANSIFIPKCLAAAKAAFESMVPVKMGIGITESEVGINRRQLLRDGTVTLGQNPWDPYDPTMTVIHFRGEDGKPIANIVHVGAHPTAAGNNYEISRDWPGVMVDRLEVESGAMSMYVNGTQGDVAPRTANGRSDGGANGGEISQAMEIGGFAGIDAVRAYKTIRTFYDESISVVYGELSLPFKEPIPKEKIPAVLAEGGHPRKAASLELLKDMYATGDFGPDTWEMRQTIVRVGPVVFVPFAFETCTEIGMRLRTYSLFAHTLLLSCTNGSNSYMTTQSQLCRGGYEVDMFTWARARQLPDDSDQRLIDQNMKLIEALYV